MDFPSVKYVINYNMPPRFEKYVRRVGREMPRGLSKDAGARRAAEQGRRVLESGVGHDLKVAVVQPTKATWRMRVAFHTTSILPSCGGAREIWRSR